MYDGVIMPHTSSVLLGLMVATIFTAPAAAETAPGRAGANAEAGAALLRADTIRLAGRGYVADLAGGGRAGRTLDTQRQQSTDNLLPAFQIPFGAAVVVSVPDGRVLAMVGQSAADPRL